MEKTLTLQTSFVVEVARQPDAGTSADAAAEYRAGVVIGGGRGDDENVDAGYAETQHLSYP